MFNDNDLRDVLIVLADTTENAHKAQWLRCAADIALLGTRTNTDVMTLRQLRLYVWRKARKHHREAYATSIISPFIADIFSRHHYSLANMYIRIVQTLNDVVAGTAERDDLDNLKMPEYLK